MSTGIIWKDSIVLDGVASLPASGDGFLREYSPRTVVTFNHTNIFAEGLRKYPKASKERVARRVLLTMAHRTLPIEYIPLLVLGLLHRRIFEAQGARSKHAEKDMVDLVHYTTFEAHTIKAARKRSNRYRKLTRPWELAGPAGRAWDVVALRKDPYELVRMAAMVMANGENTRSVLRPK